MSGVAMVRASSLMLKEKITTVGISVDGGYRIDYHCLGFEKERDNVKR